jgi:tight adherence protein B
MKYLLIFISVFVTLLIVIELILFAYRNLANPDRDSIRKRLKTMSPDEFRKNPVDVLKQRRLSEVPLLNSLLAHMRILEGLEVMREQARAKYPLGFFMLLSIISGLAVFVLCRLLSFGMLITLILAIVAIPVPFLYLKKKKELRREKFLRQLPDALDLICRALKAGHDLSSGIKIVTEEFKGPIAEEFEDALNEINFGISTKEALISMSQRVNCSDFNYFVVAVGLQRETGGNLSEIIDNISRLIRERFKFFGRVKALSAEGRFSAGVLIALPILVFIAMLIMNTSYIEVLINSDEGRKAAGIAVVMMCIGIVIIRRLIKIRV